MSNKNMRCFPLEEKIMKDKKFNDGVFAYFQIKSYIDKDGNKFIYAKDAKADVILKALSTAEDGSSKKSISKRTIENNISLFKKLNIIEKGTTEDNYGKEVDVLFIKEEFEKFQYIPYETLKFLFDASNSNVIKIYAYLLNAYKLKIMNKSNEKYVFTLKELYEAIGYKQRSENKEMMDNILLTLTNNGLIKYVEYYELNKKGVPTPKHKLVEVSTEVKGMKKQKQKTNKIAEIVDAEGHFKF